MNPLPTPPAPEKAGPSNLRQRLISGAIGATGLLGCVWLGPVTFGLFFAATQAVMLKEFYRMMRASGFRPAFWLGLVLSVLIFAATHGLAGLHSYSGLGAVPGASAARYSVGPGAVAMGSADNAAVSSSAVHLLTNLVPNSYPALILTFLLLNVILVLIEVKKWPHHGHPFSNIGTTYAGLFYVCLPMSLLNVVAFGSGSYDYCRVVCLLFLIWANDIGAYAAGRTFGRHQLAPGISPGKTWEGWAGGALLTFVIAWACGVFIPDLSFTHRLVAAGVVAVFGPLGDLAESMLKRSAGVKDSGTFLPGHGGLLDRFDAFLLVLPVLALLQLLAGQ